MFNASVTALLEALAAIEAQQGCFAKCTCALLVQHR
jgi:hypothetical protein